jgi:hypothetical protein
MTDALKARGMPDLITHLASQIGILAFKRGFSERLEADHDPEGGLAPTPPPPLQTYGQQAHRSAEQPYLRRPCCFGSWGGLDVFLVHSGERTDRARRGDQLPGIWAATCPPVPAACAEAVSAGWSVTSRPCRSHPLSNG